MQLDSYSKAPSRKPPPKRHTSHSTSTFLVSSISSEQSCLICASRSPAQSPTSVQSAPGAESQAQVSTAALNEQSPASSNPSEQKSHHLASMSYLSSRAILEPVSSIPALVNPLPPGYRTTRTLCLDRHERIWKARITRSWEILNWAVRLSPMYLRSTMARLYVLDLPWAVMLIASSEPSVKTLFSCSTSGKRFPCPRIVQNHDLVSNEAEGAIW